MGKVSGAFIRDAAIAAVISTLGALFIRYSDLPTRVSVIESQQKDIKDAVRSIDGKLDIIIQRVR